jgi:hypothetical protein
MSGYNNRMAIDGKLYREAQEVYPQWKLAEQAERAYNAGKRTLLECWQAYVAWWEFLMSITPEISETQQARRLAYWAEYYERIQKSEAWRKEHGKTA